MSAAPEVPHPGRPSWNDVGLSVDLLVCQAIVWLVAATTLDYGVLSRAVTNCFLGYWVGVAVVVRRGRRPSRSDRQFVRWGWVVLLLYGVPAAYLYWRSVGAI